jgi:hypothetical protein
MSEGEAALALEGERVELAVLERLAGPFLGAIFE